MTTIEESRNKLIHKLQEATSSSMQPKDSNTSLNNLKNNNRNQHNQIQIETAVSPQITQSNPSTHYISGRKQAAQKRTT